MAKDARIELRVPEDEKAAWVEAAEAADVGLSEWLRRAAKYAIKDEAELRENLEWGDSHTRKLLAVGREAFGITSYRCPAPGCDRTFGSERAVCPLHGRRGVPVDA
jgi:hypothetical protein